MADGTFQWGLIDHRLVGLKLTNLSEEMNESIRAEIGQIHFKNIGNCNGQAVPTQIIAMHLRRTDEWIEKTYGAYCQVWEKQGYQKTAEFVRAVSAYAIPIVISARTNGVIAELSGRRARTGSLIEPHNARMESFKREMNRLAARWSRKLEIEARECEHSDGAIAGKRRPVFDQRENVAKAIIGRKAEIERINRLLENLPSPDRLGPYGMPIRVSQRSIGNLIRRRLEHEAALAEMERELARLSPLEERTQERSRNLERREKVPLNAQTQPASAVNPVTYRTPCEGLKPEMKVFDFSSFIVDAKLTDKQSDCFSLVREYQRPMNEVEQRMGITRKTIHEHIVAAEKAIARASRRESRSKAAAKHKHSE